MNSAKSLNIEDSHALLDALLAKNAPHKTFVKGVRNYLLGCLMLEAGLRVGEVVQLRPSDLYFNAGPVFSIVVRPEISKSKKERSVPVSGRLRSALLEYLKTHDSVLQFCDDCYAFPRPHKNEPVTTRQVERIINAAGWKGLGRPVNPHMLRHTFATRLMKVTDMRTVQELLGHKHITSTQIYTHPSEEDKKIAILKICEASP